LLEAAGRPLAFVAACAVIALWATIVTFLIAIRAEYCKIAELKKRV
jgi:hypothetical protein